MLRALMAARIAAFVAFLLWANEASAEDPSREGEMRPTAPAQEAKGHFDKALDEYRAGHYRSAIGELEQAYGLDPTGKDLVYNLAVVYEKLGELDAAIDYLERYVVLETDAGELERARASIVRLRGARGELARETKPPPPAPAPCVTPSAAPPAARPAGKLDGWVIGSAGVAAAAAVVGVVFGVRALLLDPGSEPATDSSTSIDELDDRASLARSSARIADVALGVSIASGATAAVLYFGRTPDQGRGAASVGFSGRF